MKLYEIAKSLKSHSNTTYVRFNSKFGWIKFTYRRKRFELYENEGYFVIFLEGQILDSFKKNDFRMKDFKKKLFYY